MSIKQLESRRETLWQRLHAITQDEVVLDTVAELIEVELKLEARSNQ